MDGMLLILVIAGMTIQQVMKKAYNTRITGGALSFAAGSAMSALLFFVISSGGKIAFASGVSGYSILFALAFCTSTVCSLLAINEGPLSLTSLMLQYSLIIPTVYGLVVLDEPIGVSLIIGIVFLLVSLVLINVEKKGEEKKITLKWAVYAFLAFVGNGCCSLIQKIQQIHCDGQYKNEFMLLAYCIAVIVVFGFAMLREKKEVLSHMKKGWKFWLVCGLCNGLVNFLVLILSTAMPASVMFPLISAGGIIATFLVSLFVYKERLSIAQTAGLVFGIVSVVFLNI